jgi:pimeloyl-ACP methyl ester carboxylesterase
LAYFEQKIDLGNYRMDLVRRGSGVMVVTFEPMTACRRNPSRDRAGWGAKFLMPRTEDLLFVKPTTPNWYRRSDLHVWLEKYGKLFDQYDRVVLMGGSMGGFGALAFATVMRATEVLALNPQSTLANDLVPWEKRFDIGKEEDWSGPYRDAAKTLHGKVYVVADRYEPLDKLHIERLGTEIVFYNFPMVGHRVPEWLLQLKALQPLSIAVIEGGDPGPLLIQTIRRRRELERWWAGIVKLAERQRRLDRLQPFLSESVLTHCLKMDENSQDLVELRTRLYSAVALAQKGA